MRRKKKSLRMPNKVRTLAIAAAGCTRIGD
jgi:hypothetical protein